MKSFDIDLALGSCTIVGSFEIIGKAFGVIIVPIGFPELALEVHINAKTHLLNLPTTLNFPHILSLDHFRLHRNHMLQII
jgi:hypothetical protein